MLPRNNMGGRTCSWKNKWKWKVKKIVSGLGGFTSIIWILYIPQHEVRKIGDVQLEGSNASAEEMEEGTEEASESGVDLVLNHRWVENTFTFWHGHWPGWLRLGLPRRMTTWPTWKTTWRRLWSTWRKTTGRVRWTPSRRTSTVWWKGFSASSTTSSFIRVGYLFSIHLHWWLSSGLNPKLPRWVDEPCGHGRTDWLSRDWRRGAPGNTVVSFF